MQTLYGVAGERRLEEITLDWLSGYEGSKPVRMGNAAYRQFQLDIYGEIMDALHLARRAGLKPREAGWQLQRTLLAFVESVWDSPDEGIWEVRGPRHHFTYSKVMAWVALDRALRACEQFGLEGPVERWQALRERIHQDVCEKGFDARRGSFVQYYGGKGLDASLLLIPLVGFLPPSDPRVLGTLKAIEHELMIDGFVARYLTEPEVDGLPAGEGAFLACSFWLADNYALVGRRAEARALFERLLSLRSDLGLLAEQYDPKTRRLIGNYPQALSHIALINTAYNLSAVKGPAHDRHA
jgi:GH15 family glucan-1,4-alpha-glucosidase